MSSRIKKILLVAVVALILGLIYARQFKPSQSNSIGNAPASGGFVEPLSAEPTPESPDADSDGLADWEELVWKTDPENPDSDGDDTSDGDEVSMNRNPIVPGPDDVLIETERSGEISSNATEEFLYGMFETYKQLKNSEGTAEEIDSAMRSLIESGNVQFPVRPYSTRDFLSVDETPASLSRYAQAFVASLNKHFPANQPNELEILERSLRAENPEILSELNPIILAYQSMTRDMLSFDVPRGLLLQHTSLSSTFKILGETTAAFPTFHTDVIAGLSAMDVYIEHVENLDDQVGSIVAYLSQKGVQFTGSR